MQERYAFLHRKAGQDLEDRTTQRAKDNRDECGHEISVFFEIPGNTWKLAPSEGSGNEQHRITILHLDRGQTTEICEKQEKYFKGNVVTLTVQSLILYQYPVDLLTFFELY